MTDGLTLFRSRQPTTASRLKRVFTVIFGKVPQRKGLANRPAPEPRRLDHACGVEGDFRQIFLPADNLSNALLFLLSLSLSLSRRRYCCIQVSISGIKGRVSCPVQ